MADQIPDARLPYFLTIGEALYVWNEMETHLCVLVAKLLGPADFKATQVVMHCVRFPEKLRIASELVEFRVADSELKRRWRLLSKRLGNGMKKRNNLVHWTLIPYGPTQDRGLYRNVIFTPSATDPRNLKEIIPGELPFKESLKPDEIVEFTKEFMSLSADVFRFDRDVRVQPASRKKHP